MEREADRPLRLVVLVGNPSPNSRTLAFATELACNLRDRVGGEFNPATVVDLSVNPGTVFDRTDPTMCLNVESVTAADLLIVASPVYKATYTGLLKAFLDRVAPGGLGGVVAVAVMVGSALDHSLAGEVFLRPLLSELGATVPTSALFALDRELDVESPQAVAWLERAATSIALLLR